MSPRSGWVSFTSITLEVTNQESSFPTLSPPFLRRATSTMSACAVCTGPAWYCPCFQAVPETFLRPGPFPVVFQQPDFGSAAVAPHDWSPAAVSGSTRTGPTAAAETSAYSLMHAREEGTTSHARAGASEAVTASPAVREPARQQRRRRRSVLDRGQAAETSRVVCPTLPLFSQVTDADMSTAEAPVDKRSVKGSDASWKGALSTVARRKRARTDRA